MVKEDDIMWSSAPFKDGIMRKGSVVEVIEKPDSYMAKIIWINVKCGRPDEEEQKFHDVRRGGDEYYNGMEVLVKLAYGVIPITLYYKNGRFTDPYTAIDYDYDGEVEWWALLPKLPESHFCVSFDGQPCCGFFEESDIGKTVFTEADIKKRMGDVL